MDEFFKKFIIKIIKDCTDKTPTGINKMLATAKAEDGITDDIEIIFKSLGQLTRDDKELFLICFSDGVKAMEVNNLKLETTILFTKSL